jgi:hypothetical protein
VLKDVTWYDKQGVSEKSRFSKLVRTSTRCVEAGIRISMHKHHTIMMKESNREYQSRVC